MDFLWSPWRYKYVSREPASTPCVFCVGDSPALDQERLILFRGDSSFVIMNLYPYSSGHLLIVPYAHIASVTDTNSEQMIEMTGLVRRSVEVLEEVYKPEGFNLGANLGACAGAGIRDHLHFHVVPRWCGDTNFMTVTGETRVIPEDLRDSYLKLREAFG